MSSVTGPPTCPKVPKHFSIFGSFLSPNPNGQDLTGNGRHLYDRELPEALKGLWDLGTGNYMWALFH